jgi:hypothetical protein
MVHARPNTDASKQINLKVLQCQVEVPSYCLDRNRFLEMYRCLLSCNYRFIDSVLVVVKGSLFLYEVEFKACRVVCCVV